MRKFNEKVAEILELHKHLDADDWQNICFVMFLEYQNETCKLKDLQRKTRDTLETCPAKH